MFVVRFITKFGESLPPCQKNSAQIHQSAPGELGSGAANRSVNPELICPPYILWPRRVCAGLDPSSHDPRPVVACRATCRRAISAVVTEATPVIARPCTWHRVLRIRRRPIFFKYPYPLLRAVHPSLRVAYPSLRPFPRPPYKYARVFFFPALCQSIPACTCHGDRLRDSLKGANYFSSHIIHHH